MPRLKLEIITDARGAITDIKGLDKTIDNLDKSTKKAGTSTKGMWKQMALGQAAWQAVAAGLRIAKDELISTVTLASEAIETESKFNTVFLTVANKASEAQKQLASDYGLSTLASQTMMSATGDLLTGLGMEAGAALDLSTKTQQLAVDLASFTNYQGGATGASEAITKAMLGEREMMKSLGIVITEAMVKDELLARGKSKLTGLALNEAKAEAVLAIAYKQSKNAIGDYARTKDSFANVSRRLGQIWEDLKVTAGKVFIDALGPMLTNVRDWFDENREAVEQFVKSAAEGLVEVADVLGDILGLLFDIAKAVDDLSPKLAVSGIAGAFKDLSDEYERAAAAEKKYMEQFRAFRDHAKLTTTQTLKMRDAHASFQERLQAIARGDYGTKLAKQWRKWNTEQRTGHKIIPQTTGLIDEQAEAMEALWQEYGKLSKLVPKYTDHLDRKANPTIKDHFDVMIKGGPVIEETTWSYEELFGEIVEGTEDVGKFGEEMADLFWVLKDFGGILGPLGEGFADLFAGFAEMEKGVALGGIAGATGVIGGLLAGVQGLQALGLEFSFKEDSNIGKMMAANKAFGDIMSTASAEGFKWTLEFAKQVEALKSTMSGDKANILQNLLDKNALQTIEMGFGSLIAKAKEFGLEGGRIVIETLQEIEANGLRIAEVERYKNEQLDAGLVAYKQMREAVGQNQAAFDVFGDVSIGVFDDMLEYQALVAENQAFLNGLKGYTDAWIHFSNVTELNQQQFDDFKSKAIDAYKQLQTQGFTSSQALKEIAPMLKRLQLLQHDFGLEVDDTTQGLIDQADSKGYLEELNEPMGEMVKILQDIADLLGNAFPAAAKQAGEAIQYHFKKARDTMDDFNDSAKSGARYTSKGGVSAGDEVGGYAGGTQGWEPQPDAAWVGEDGPEFVRKRGNLWDVTPAGNRQTTPIGGQAVRLGVTSSPTFNIYPKSEDVRGIAREVFRLQADNMESTMDNIMAKVDKRIDKRLGEA